MGEFRQVFPGGSNGIDTLRIIIRAFRSEKQNLNPKLANHLVLGDPLYKWDMIAPSDIQEHISHNWEEYHSIQGRATQIRADFIKSLGKISDAASSVGQRSEGDTSAGKVKVDSPLVYAGSNRREYTFMFALMEYTNIVNDVTEPINRFRKYSCASIVDVNADTIEFPAVFNVQTYPMPFISIDYAVLTDVQVVYNSPYKAGFPQRAELTLTFRDIRPLYTSSWEKKMENKVTTEFRRR